VIIRAAGHSLTVGELREALFGLHDGDLITAHGLLVDSVEAISGIVRLDDDVDDETKEDALSDLLDFARRLSTDMNLKLKEARKLATDLVEEWPV
jgi:hypothetical protein